MSKTQCSADGQLDHAETRAQVAAGDGHGIDGLETQLVGELTQIGFGKLAEVLGRFDGVEERGFTH